MLLSKNFLSVSERKKKHKGSVREKFEWEPGLKMEDSNSYDMA